MISQRTAKKIKEEFGYDFLLMSWEEISRYKGLCKYKGLCEAFIEKYIDRVNWYFISIYQKLSEDFIEEHTDKINWDNISICQHLSESFIEKHIDRVNWYFISIYQKLSENFIEKHTDKLNWEYISRYQCLSENFIEKHTDKLNWNNISKYQVITPEFADKHNIKINNNSQKVATEWKKMIEKTGLYECHENYFYAYKNIRNDRYSHFNFLYLYLPGETYDCFSDYSDGENSFGFSAWTETKACDYSGNGMVVKLKINYADVTAIVHGSNKIRCKRITVLN